MPADLPSVGFLFLPPLLLHRPLRTIRRLYCKSVDRTALYQDGRHATRAGRTSRKRQGDAGRAACAAARAAYIGTGDILRDAIRAGTADGSSASSRSWISGLLVPDSEVNAVVAELFSRGEPAREVRHRRLSADATPRRLPSMPARSGSASRSTAVVNLTIPDDEVVRRISGRRCCSNRACAICYNVYYRPSKAAGKCDKCGSPLDPPRRRQGRNGPPPAQRVPQDDQRPAQLLPQGEPAPRGRRDRSGETIYANIVKAINVPV